MREEEVRKQLKEHGIDFEEFYDWMRGQTVGVYPDGTIDYYEYDVKRFIEGEKRWI